VLHPLSLTQQRLWILDQLTPTRSVHTIPLAARLVGQLDLAALTSSLDGLLERHETLRTSVRVVEGEPATLVAPEGHVALARCDLRALPAAEREPEVWRHAAEEMRRAFDLTQAPLIRAHLFHLDDEEHV